MPAIGAHPFPWVAQNPTYELTNLKASYKGSIYPFQGPHTMAPPRDMKFLGPEDDHVPHNRYNR